MLRRRYVGLKLNLSFRLRRELDANDRRCAIGEEHGKLPPPPETTVQLGRHRRGEVQAETRERAKDGRGVFLGRNIEIE